MRHSSPTPSCWLLLAALLSTLLPTFARATEEPEFSAGTTFTYQGNLQQRGQPANGVFDLSFALFDARSDGQAFGQIDLFDVPVKGGTFTVELDFLRPVFSGEKLWLETQVRAAGKGAFARLEPRDLLLGKGGTTCAVDNDVLITGRLDVNPSGTDPGLNVYCCNEADLDGGGQITLQSPLGELRMDYNEIQATALNTPQMFQINPHGGNIGLGVSNPAAPVHILGGPDVTPSGGGALVIGLSTNIAIDQNEIQAHSAGAPALLTLNNDGGEVRIGGNLGIGMERIEESADAVSINVECPSGKKIISGGCYGGTQASFPTNDGTEWRCIFADSSTNTAYAVCARVSW